MTHARTVRIGRGLHLRMRTDLLLDLVRHARGLAGAVAGLVLLALLSGRLVAGAVAVVAVLLGWAGVRWVQLGRDMRGGLGVGQHVVVAHAVDGDPAVVVTDVTGQVLLGRGSALVVNRFRSLVRFHGRELSFALPTELLSDTEAAFLEGGRPSPAEGPTDDGPASDLPLSLTVTEHEQQRAVSALVRALLTSADALLPAATTLVFLGLGSALGSGLLLVVGGGLAAVLVLSTARGVLRAGRAVRATYRVGRTVHAEVTRESLTLQLGTVVHRVRWEAFGARRVTDDAVLLRRRGPFLSADVLAVYPRALFDEDAIADLAGALRRTF